MLSKDFELTDQLYNPINNLTQMELMEKFNIAFYEGQNLSRYEISEVFEEYTPVPKFDKATSPIEEDHIPIDILVDYLTEPNTPTTNLDFDFDNFNSTLDFIASNKRQSIFSESDSFGDSETYVKDSEYKSANVFSNTTDFGSIPKRQPCLSESDSVIDSETYGTDSEYNSVANFNATMDFIPRQSSFSESESLADSENYIRDSDYNSVSTKDDASQFSELFNPIQTQEDQNDNLLDHLDLDDICESLSNNSFDFNDLTYDICELNNDGLSEIGTDRTNMEFNQYLRSVPADDLSFTAQVN